MPAYFQDNSKLIRVDRLRNSKIIDLAVRAEPEHPKPLHDSLVGRPAFLIRKAEVDVRGNLCRHGVMRCFRFQSSEGSRDEDGCGGMPVGIMPSMTGLRVRS